MYYDRNGSPITIAQFSEYFRDRSYRVLAQNLIGCEENQILVSTVWLGLDHSFYPSVQKHIFETMVFGKDSEVLDQARYAREEEAFTGHRDFLEKYSGACSKSE